MEITLPPLHPGQREVALSEARFKVLSAGRRWGKTRLGALKCIKAALEGLRAWWVAPTYPIASVGWRQIRQLGRQIPGSMIHRGERTIEFVTGGCVQVRSADNPDSLRGEGLDLVVLDEAAFMAREAWYEALRPALADRRGSALFISTPNGRNWFHDMWEGAIGEEWARFNYPTSANPYIDPREIEAARETLPERVFLQEFMAEFVDQTGAVFRRVDEAATAARQEAAVKDEHKKTHMYVMGIDWGKYEDFTVMTVVDVTDSALVYIDRFRKIDYMLQVQRLKALVERFNPQIIVPERNAMGEPIIEQIQRMGMPVQPFTTNNASKAEAVEALALAFEEGKLRILPDPVLISELKAYEAKRLPSGLLRYQAPDGLHDDCVMSLALAWTAARPASQDMRIYRL